MQRWTQHNARVCIRARTRIGVDGRATRELVLRGCRTAGAGVCEEEDRTSVESGVGTECVCVCELDSCVWVLEGDRRRRGWERYSGGVGASDGSRRYARMLGARGGKSASPKGR